MPVEPPMKATPLETTAVEVERSANLAEPVSEIVVPETFSTWSTPSVVTARYSSSDTFVMLAWLALPRLTEEMTEPSVPFTR